MIRTFWLYYIVFYMIIYECCNWLMKCKFLEFGIILCTCRHKMFSKFIEILLIFQIVGYLAVYRLCFAMSLFFFVMALLMVGVKSSKDPRAAIQNGWDMPFWAYHTGCHYRLLWYLCFFVITRCWSLLCMYLGIYVFIFINVSGVISKILILMLSTASGASSTWYWLEPLLVRSSFLTDSLDKFGCTLEWLVDFCSSSFSWCSSLTLLTPGLRLGWINMRKLRARDGESFLPWCGCTEAVLVWSIIYTWLFIDIVLNNEIPWDIKVSVCTGTVPCFRAPSSTMHWPSLLWYFSTFSTPRWEITLFCLFYFIIFLLSLLYFG